MAVLSLGAGDTDRWVACESSSSTTSSSSYSSESALRLDTGDSADMRRSKSSEIARVDSDMGEVEAEPDADAEDSAGD